MSRVSFSPTTMSKASSNAGFSSSIKNTSGVGTLPKLSSGYKPPSANLPSPSKGSGQAIGGYTGSNGGVVTASNNKPEFMRKVAMNKYLEKIAETASVGDRAATVVRDGAIGGIIGGITGGVAGTGIGIAEWPDKPKMMRDKVNREVERRLFDRDFGKPLGNVDVNRIPNRQNKANEIANRYVRRYVPRDPAAKRLHIASAAAKGAGYLGSIGGLGALGLGAVREFVRPLQVEVVDRRGGYAE